eukprot:g8007.t1
MKAVTAGFIIVQTPAGSTVVSARVGDVAPVAGLFCPDNGATGPCAKSITTGTPAPSDGKIMDATGAWTAVSKNNPSPEGTLAFCALACGKGKYSSDRTVSFGPCKDCAKGTYGDQVGQDAQADCKDCAKGTYGDQAGQDAQADCKGCAKGTYGDQAGQDAAANCKDCAKGLYNDQTGQDEAADCKNCAKGKYTEKTRNIAASDCKDVTTAAPVTTTSPPTTTTMSAAAK